MCHQGQGTPRVRQVRAPRQLNGKPLLGFIRCKKCTFNSPLYVGENDQYAFKGEYRCPQKGCDGLLRFDALEDESGE